MMHKEHCSVGRSPEMERPKHYKVCINFFSLVNNFKTYLGKINMGTELKNFQSYRGSSRA
jgi:hypothetical protein